MAWTVWRSNRNFRFCHVYGYPGYQRFFLACDGELRFVSSAAGRPVFSRRLKTRGRRRGWLFKTWPKPETAHEKPLAPRVVYGKYPWWIDEGFLVFSKLHKMLRTCRSCYVWECLWEFTTPLSRGLGRRRTLFSVRLACLIRWTMVMKRDIFIQDAMLVNFCLFSYILFFYFQGFCELIPHNLIQIFDERELEVNMCFLCWI